MVRVRLLKKLAEKLNGVDLSECKVGDIIELSNALAAMLIREGWAEHIVNPSTE
jgi:hypothetical protein